MIAILKTVIATIMPWVGKIFGKDSEKAMELKAQKELEEIRAFRKGRITPRFLLFYLLICIFAIAAVLLLLSLFFPDFVAAPDMGKIKDILDMGSGLVP